MGRRVHSCVRLLAVFALLAPFPAPAATISGVTITLNAGNSPDFFDNVGAVASAVQSTAAITANTSTAFDARYAAVVSADRGGSGGPGTTTQSFTGDFTITLQLTETAGTPWSFTLDVMRIGAQTLVSDGSGNGSVALGALTGTETGAGSISSGSMSLAALTTLTNAGVGGTPSANTAFSQTTNAIISGLGTGFAQSVVLNFSFTASATSVDPSGGSVQGDEAALRMGLDSALTSFTADNYPGAGLRNLVTDGIYVFFLLEPAPEPGTALLLGLGLAALGIRRRAHRARRR